MKKNFTTGLAILLPIVLTCIIVSFLINVLTNPFLESTQHLLDQFSFFQNPFYFLTSETWRILVSKMFILIFLLLLVLLIGILGKYFLIDLFFKIGDFFFHRLPFINKIYKACKEVVGTLFSSSKSTFSQVVFVPFPNNTQLSMGLVTQEPLKLEESSHTPEWVPVFVPCVPNPTQGMMQMFRKEELIHTNLKVEEAMKCIMSCGVIIPQFTSTITK